MSNFLILIVFERKKYIIKSRETNNTYIPIEVVFGTLKTDLFLDFFVVFVLTVFRCFLHGLFEDVNEINIFNVDFSLLLLYNI